MPLSEEALGALLLARSAYIDQAEYTIPDWHNVIEAHTKADSPERAACVDREALEKSLFDQADLYDLGKTDCVDQAISADSPREPMVQRSSTHWAVSEYARLDSPALAKLISSMNKDKPSAPEVAPTVQPTAPVENEDWDVDD
ncbi:hypothetical protein B0H17DRAFT_1197279 [Mycena rosella]|uniref:Uncharacterized protein n=1 Tax=Mycena rosella TaxID=1033263 RepID=A0AAD7DRW4_MYCRO|nr:hypothetical protein B0H17DRAFT_1197279 [Mycena rosella]